MEPVFLFIDTHNRDMTLRQRQWIDYDISEGESGPSIRHVAGLDTSGMLSDWLIQQHPWIPLMTRMHDHDASNVLQ